MQAPTRTQVSHLIVLMGQTRDISLPTQLTSILVVSPEIASAVLHSRGLTVTGLKVGETMLIGFDQSGRHTFLIQVRGRTRENTPAEPLAMASPTAGDENSFSGQYSLEYSAPFAGAPTAWRQTFDFHKKLSGGRTLRFASDMFKFSGSGDHLRATSFGLGVNRMSLGIDGPDGSLDVLDSQINITPLSFSGYAMRGFHLVSTPTSRYRGIEIFAGLARPSLSMFDMNRGRVIGAIVPIVRGEFWRVRAGMFSVYAGENNRLGKGGTVWHLDGRSALGKNLTAEGEVAYAKGGLSWRGRLNLQTKNVSGYGEVLRLDRQSPLVSIGAQYGGRESETFAFHWRPGRRFNTSVNYDHTAIVPPATGLRAMLDRTMLSVNAGYQLTQDSRLGFSFLRQQIETGAPSGGARFRLDTRTMSVSHDIRFNERWSNSFTGSLNSSREPLSDRKTESGIILREQLRYLFKRGSATGFVQYARQGHSLAGLIVSNPQLLPPVLQEAFAADPARFLEQHRDSLNLLLPGVELPQTTGLDAGLRLQAAFSKVNLNSEVRYSAGQFLGRSQRGIVTTANLNLRLDAANAVQLSGSRSFGFDGRGQSQLTVSYVHRFGAGSGGGRQFSELLGLDRGAIQGRIFFDLNSNGQDDTNEPGVPGITVRLDGDRNATTDALGHFRFQSNPGAYHIAVVSADLGATWRATSATEQRGFLSVRQTVNVSFGLNNYGSIAGRVFNDVSQKGEQAAETVPGVGGVRLSLRPMNADGPASSQALDGTGAYHFRNLPPGSYALDIDSATLPADFRVPAQTSWIVVVKPLQNVYHDIPLSAQRAVSGVVFIDKDSDGRFDPLKDETVSGALVISGKTEATTGKGGTYILRSLPPGKTEVRARAPWGGDSDVLRFDLEQGPSRRKSINIAVRR